MIVGRRWVFNGKIFAHKALSRRFKNCTLWQDLAFVFIDFELSSLLLILQEFAQICL